jgi:DNA mismatch endonuclease, patch repair protein
MSRIRSEGTRTETALRSELHKRGFRFRKNFRGVIGAPDIAFPRQKVAVFIDGDFWHGRMLGEMTSKDELLLRLKTRNREFWIAKLSRNRERDIHVTRTLGQLGWLVLRFWETDAAADLEAAIRKISTAVESRYITTMGR